MEDTTLTFLGLSFILPAAAKQLFVASLFGLAIGTERKWHQKIASLRTFSFLSTGSCLFTILSVEAATRVAEHQWPYDETRIAAGIVTGIGFLGGGVIFKTQDRIEGVTTGAMLWITVALGMACGFNRVELAAWGLAVYIISYIFAATLHRAITFLKNMDAENEKNVSD